MTDWAPTTSEEIRQCVRTLVATTPGTVPFHRSMGVDAGLDTPTPAAVQRLRVFCTRAVKAYEPRARVRRVEVTQGADGHQVIPEVLIEEVS